MAASKRIDIGMAIRCKPSATTFSDLTEDCQRHFFRNVPLNQRMLIRSVCSGWKKIIDESFKNLKKLRIFDSRQSLVDYAHTLHRTSQQRNPELSFDPYDTLILTIPNREQPQSNGMKRYTDLSDFIKPLFPGVTSLVIWTNYITCTPGQLDVAKLISAWQSTLQVLSVNIYVSGQLKDYIGIDMKEFLLLRTNQLEAISKLPLLRRFYMGELESQPNVFIPEKVRWLRPSSRYNFQCLLQLPNSVKQLSFNFREFDFASHWLITSLQKNATHVTEFDVTFMRKNANFRKLHCFLIDVYMALPNVVKLSVDVCTLRTELNTIPQNMQNRDELQKLQKKFLSSSAIETIEHISLTDRFNFLHNNSSNVNYPFFNFQMQAKIFGALGAAFPKLQSLTMVSKYADNKDYQIFVRSLVFSNCPLRWAELLHFKKPNDCLPIERKMLQFWAAEKNVSVADQFIPFSAALHKEFVDKSDSDDNNNDGKDGVEASQ
ncbi:hypothetical protein TYRP_016227 [Tyrophagus putrescentiae]|nr:hypothetical protein TYRP_016227 [Tyrophagus putrescentiae]